MDTINPSTLSRLRAYLGEKGFALNDRLPPERELSEQLGVSRADLRKAMAILESEGQVWRHVGRGTFIGAKPILNLDDVRFLSSITSPMQIMEARMASEPELAGLAAIHGVSADFAELGLCIRRCREAKTWSVYEAWDNRFHYAIASATKNKLLMTLFDTLNAVRRSMAWRTTRATPEPPADYRSFFEHEAIHDAIIRHDAHQATETMRGHLESVRARLMASVNARA
jgi:DNA-binding FadR family transcriptional regulator